MDKILANPNINEQIKMLLDRNDHVKRLVTIIRIIKNHKLSLDNTNMVLAFSKLRNRCINDVEFNKYNWLEFLLSVTLELYPDFFTAIILAIDNNYPLDNLKKLVTIVAIHEQNNHITNIIHSLSYSTSVMPHLSISNGSTNCVYCNLYDYYNYNAEIIYVRGNYRSDSMGNSSNNKRIQIRSKEHFDLILKHINFKK